MSKSSKRIPGPKGELLLGSYPKFKEDPLAFLRETAKEFGPVARFNLAGFRFILLSDPKDVEFVFKNDHKLFGKSKSAKRVSPILGNGLLLSEGYFWRRQRKLSAPAFRPGTLAATIPFIMNMTSSWLEEQENASDVGEISVPLRQGTAHLAMNILSQFFLTGDGIDCGHELSETVIRLIDEFGERSMKGMVLPLWIPTPKHQMIKKKIKVIDDLIAPLIAYEQAQEPRGTLLSNIVHEKDENGESMSAGQVRDEVMTFILAGHETTSNTLSWCLYLINHHPEVQEKIIQELDELIGDGIPAAKDLSKLKYLTMVIEEAMRLFPPAWALRRELKEPVTIKGFQLEAGEMVMISQWVNHHDEQNWPDPFAFKPERMSLEEKQSRPDFAYFPFGGGPRRCIGSNLAMIESLSILASLFQTYSIIPNPDLKTRPKAGLTVHPEEEIHLQLKRRK